jgi:hypothetical protein
METDPQSLNVTGQEETGWVALHEITAASSEIRLPPQSYLDVVNGTRRVAVSTAGDLVESEGAHRRRAQETEWYFPAWHEALQRVERRS